jgi:peptidoglycan/LPS O-acetylase OafA/YrhL
MKKPGIHRQGIDLARFVAAFGVVVAHALASPRDWVGHLSLAMFLILTAFLAVQSAQRAGGTYAFAARARRVILPWVVWSAAFRVLDMAISDRADRFVLMTDPWSLAYGSIIHLWFLPFVAVAIVLVGPAVRLITTPARLAIASSGLVAIAAPLFWAHEAMGWPEPVPQWLFAMPLYALGLLIGIAQPMGRVWMPLLGAAALTGTAVLVGNAAPWTLTVALAVLAFQIFWHLPLYGTWLPHLGQVSFGIYLIHPFFMLVVYKMAGAGVDRLAGAVVAFMMSWAAVAVLRRLPLFARIT